jgi:hypothetical protein
MASISAYEIFSVNVAYRKGDFTIKDLSAHVTILPVISTLRVLITLTTFF